MFYFFAMKNNYTMKKISILLFAFMLAFQPVCADAAVSNVSVYAGSCVAERRPGDNYRERPISRKEFKQLCGFLKDESFDDGKLVLVKVACMGCYFTSKQCAQMLSCFTFEKNRLAALEIMLPRIMELRDAEDILEEFSFKSDREKAAAMLLRAAR